MRSFPSTRLRRLRSSQAFLDVFAENSLAINDLIAPLIVCEDKVEKKNDDNLLVGLSRFNKEEAIKRVKEFYDLGIRMVMLFPHYEGDNEQIAFKESFSENGFLQKIIKDIKKSVPNMILIGDIALDAYSASGHDGILNDLGDVDNDKTIDLLCKQTLAQVKAGIDVIAPSDMMDGRIGKLREYLDKLGYHNVAIFSYSAKYASNFYGPYKKAIGANPLKGRPNKRSYQMPYSNSEEALWEVHLDLKEGADALIVKPAMMYLDIINKISTKYNVPIIAFQVSGEYAAIKSAASRGYINEIEAVFEIMVAFKRSGARAIITYWAYELASLLNNNN